MSRSKAKRYRASIELSYDLVVTQSKYLKLAKSLVVYLIHLLLSLPLVRLPLEAQN